MSLSVQFLSLLAMIGTGIMAAAFIDMIGTGTASAGKTSFIRRHSTVFEVLGWTIAGCWTFSILYIVRDGGWRIYDPFAQVSGILLYASVFHKPIRFVGRIILILFVKPLWFIISTFFSMIWKLLRFFLKMFFLLFTPFVKLFRKIKGKHFKN